MNLKNYWWCFESALSKRFCDDLIEYGSSKEEKIALTGKFKNKEDLTKKEKNNLKKQRDSYVTWLTDNWIYKEIQPFIHMANKNAGWNFDWNFSESCQFTKYKLNQFYDWHCDSWNEPYGKNHEYPDYANKIRKLSVTCSLSDPNDYKGGQLEFDYRNYEKSKNNKSSIVECKAVLPRGSICVFPSFVWHRVKPVTKGTRYSLVVWNLGYPYK
jgi:PKHD-type hydroxylase